MKRKFIASIAVLLLILSFMSKNAEAAYYPAYAAMYQGMQNQNVLGLQKDLKTLGYFSVSPTGYFGSYTKQSVIAFQRANGLASDGVVGRMTAKELKVDMVTRTAKLYQGVPYAWGGTSPAGFDCSGFTHYVFLKNGITIARTSELQYNEGVRITKDQLRPGDLVFFTTYKPGPSHVGIYLGNNQFIHASSGAAEVKISDINSSYYTQHYIGARRIIS